MPPASRKTSVLYSTEHGRIDWTSGPELELTLGDCRWTVTSDEVHALRDALQPLAAQVYRCNCECRWQVRRDGGGTIVLGTDEVLRLHSLLEGAVAMLELYSFLEDASIARSGEC